MKSSFCLAASLGGCKVLPEIVVDTSAVLAVLLNQPEKHYIIEQTVGCSLLAPFSMPWEVGNALSAMIKRKRIKIDQALEVLNLYDLMPLRYLDTKLSKALEIASRLNLYAYDAYFIECSLRFTKPLLTLDRRLAAAAKQCKVALLEKRK